MFEDKITTMLLFDQLNFAAVVTFSEDADGNLLMTSPLDIESWVKVQFTTVTTLPTGLELLTDYWLVRVTDKTALVATSLARALAGTVVEYTDAGTGAHTVTWLIRDSVPIDVRQIAPSWAFNLQHHFHDAGAATVKLECLISSERDGDYFEACDDIEASAAKATIKFIAFSPIVAPWMKIRATASAGTVTALSVWLNCR